MSEPSQSGRRPNRRARSYRPPGTLGVLRLLAVTSIRRLARSAKVRQQKREHEAGASRTKKRSATARKRGDGLIFVMLLLMPLFVFQGLMMSHRAAANLYEAVHMVHPDGRTLFVPGDVRTELGGAEADLTDEDVGELLDKHGIDEHSYPTRSEILSHWSRKGTSGMYSHGLLGPEILSGGVTWKSDDARSLYLVCGSLLLVTLGLMMLAVSLGGANATLAGGEWTQAWLMSFPVSTRSLVLARALEYSLVQLFPWFTVFPLCYQLLRALSQPGALWIALLATLTTTFLVGAARLWLETTLRLRLSLRGLKNFQGACTVLSLVFMAIVFGSCLGKGIPTVFLDVCVVLPDWLSLLPTAWPLGLTGYGVIAAVVGLLVTAATFAFAIRHTAGQLRGGFMRSQGVDAGKRGDSFDWKRHAKQFGIAGKDLMLLRRDRNFMVQTLLVPIFVIGLQLIVNPGLGNAEGVGIPMIAYFIGFYGCMGGCFQVLSGEGRALWMLYTLPVTITDVLRQKTRIWATIAILFALTALVVFSVGRDVEVSSLLVDFALVGIGVWSAAHIAAGIGVLGANPTADYVPKQPKPQHVYLFLFFGSTFFAVLGAPDGWTRAAGTVIFVTLAYALWQRACDRLLWLLDPVEEPHDHITLLDGATAVLVFFLLQLLATVILKLWSVGDSMQESLLWGFTIAGALTVALAWLLLYVRDVSLQGLFGWTSKVRTMIASSGVAVALGIGIAILGLQYLAYADRLGWLDPESFDTSGTAFLLLGCVAAPIIEEILFRGLVLTGMLRTMREPWAILWSSLLFAAVHPHVAWPPVFLVGVACALLYRRTGFLPASMLLHASYNYVVLAYQ